MRLPRGSGSAWLALNIGAAVWFFCWILGPMHFEAAPPGVYARHTDYLRDLVDRADGPDRRAIAGAYVEAALAGSMGLGSPEVAFSALEHLRATAPDAIPAGIDCIAPGVCWSLATAAAGAPAVVILHGAAAAPAAAELTWHGEHGRTTVNGAVTELAFTDGVARSSHALAAGGYLTIVVDGDGAPVRAVECRLRPVGP